MSHPFTAASAALMAAFALAGCHRAHSGSMPAPGAGHAGHSAGGDSHSAHGQRFSKLTVSPDKEPQSGSDTTLLMRVGDAGGSTIKDFEVVHDHKAHLIIVTSGLDQFAHVHPQLAADGSMTISHRFPVGGHYLLFLDYKPVGQPQSKARAELHVGGQTVSAPELRPNVPGIVEMDEIKAAVSVSASDAGAKRLVFKLLDKMGRPVTNLEPYMGAMGHLVVISADGKDYVHAHMEGAEADKGVVTFEAHFKNPGLYKGWGQFQQNGRIRVVPFVIRNE